MVSKYMKIPWTKKINTCKTNLVIRLQDSVKKKKKVFWLSGFEVVLWERLWYEEKKRSTQGKEGQNIINKYGMEYAEVKVFSHLFSSA